jgi:hypothetical protein
MGTDQTDIEKKTTTTTTTTTTKNKTAQRLA